MNLPNRLTVFRITLVPIIILLFVFPIGGNLNVFGELLPINQLIVTILFAVASFTDFLDGKIARDRKLVTTFGKFMDPIADKLLVNSLIIILASTHRIHMLVAVIMICRDLVVDAIRLLAAQNNVVLAASNLGKAKTFTQMFAIIFILLNNIPFCFINIPVDTILIWTATLISFVSGVDYFMKNKHFIMESM